MRVKMIHRKNKTPIEVGESQVESMKKKGWKLQPKTKAKAEERSS